MNSDDDIEVLDDEYVGLLMFARKKCGADFIDGLTDGSFSFDIFDYEYVRRRGIFS